MATDEATLRARILEAAMDQAARDGWHDLSLVTLAGRLEISLAELHAEFRDRDAIANAWFDRALAAMLAPAPEGFAALRPSRRAEAMILRWFRAQSPHARLAGEMLRVKAWPSHPHHWVPMVFDLSRLVHWWLDASQIEEGGVRRMVQEVRLTTVLLAALVAWQKDAKAGEPETLPRTQALLARGLKFLDH